MSKHRAGPWHVERIPESAFGKHGITTSVGSNHYCGDYVAVVSADGIIICDNAGYYPEAIDPDDAPVIAAAPELIEALEAALEWIDAVPPDVALPAMPGFDRDWVNEILAEAKGESS